MKHYKKILLIIITFILAFSTSVFAKEVDVKLTNAKIVEKSGNAVAEDPSFNSDSINANITFTEEDDFVTYELTIKNLDEDKWKINSIEDNNENNNLQIEYNFDEDYIEKNNTGKVKIKLIYKDKLVNTDSISIDNLKITLNLVNDSGEKSSIVINNPTTHDGIIKYLVLLIVATTSLYCIKSRKRLKRLKIGNLLLLIAIFMSPFMIFANEKYQINIKFNSLILKSEMLPYEVSFDSDGGNNIESKTLKYGDKLGNLPAAEKTGYTFNGWKDSSGNSVDEETIVTDELELKANYTIIEYNITYNLNKGNVNNPKTYTVEDEITLNNPTRAGYTFTGWTGSNGETNETLVTIEKGTTGNKEFTANFTANENTPYKVIHKYQKVDGVNYEEEIEELVGTSDEEVTPNVKTKTGFTSPTEETITIKADGTSELTYEYIRNKYTLSFSDKTYIDLDNSSSEGNYYYDTSLNIKAKDKTGYTFVGWSNGASAQNYKFNISRNLTLEPVYRANTDTPYKVIHKQMGLDGITYTVKDTQNKTGTTDSEVTPAVNTYEGFTSPTEKTVTIKADGTLEVEYLYTRNKYSLTIEDSSNVDSTHENGEYYYGTEITIEAKDKEGYKFEKWSTGETNKKITMTLRNNTTIKPIYSAKTYKIVFNSNNGTGSMSDQELTYDKEEKIKKNEYTKSGYRFKNWNTKENGTGTTYSNEESVKNITTDESITLYAQWEEAGVCIRAKNLHTEECTNNSNANEYCAVSGYKTGGKKETTTITYGSLGNDGVLKTGDAFDCDVDGSGTYDEDERFYYITDLDSQTAVLIYYSNVINGEPDNTTGVKNANNTKEGPSEGYKQLPSTTEWKNVSLKNPSRTILNELGTNVTNQNADTIQNPFTYTGKAARYLSLDDIEEIYTAKGFERSFVRNGYLYSRGLFDDYPFFLENTTYAKTGIIGGYWLENPKSDGRQLNLDVYAQHVTIGNNTTYDKNKSRGVRPVIEVPKSDISY